MKLVDCKEDCQEDSELTEPHVSTDSRFFARSLSPNWNHSFPLKMTTRAAGATRRDTCCRINHMQCTCMSSVFCLVHSSAGHQTTFVGHQPGECVASSVNGGLDFQSGILPAIRISAFHRNGTPWNQHTVPVSLYSQDFSKVIVQALHSSPAMRALCRENPETRCFG